jgi:ketosteroid isomerase-like protein
MTPEEVVRAWNDAYCKHDVDGALEHMSEDFIRLGDSTLWTPMTKQQSGDMWRRFFDAFPDWSWEMTSLIPSGDTVVCEFTETGTWTRPYHLLPGLTLEPTHTSFLDHDSDWFTVKDGLITEIRAYVTNNVDRAYHLAARVEEHLSAHS